MSGYPAAVPADLLFSPASPTALGPLCGSYQLAAAAASPWLRAAAYSPASPPVIDSNGSAYVHGRLTPQHVSHLGPSVWSPTSSAFSHPATAAGLNEGLPLTVCCWLWAKEEGFASSGVTSNFGFLTCKKKHSGPLSFLFPSFHVPSSPAVSSSPLPFLSVSLPLRSFSLQVGPLSAVRWFEGALWAPPVLSGAEDVF